MRKLAVPIALCILATFAAAALAAETPEAQGTKAPAVEKQQAVKPMKAKPVGKPHSASTREKLSATGYFDKEQDEPTQERPNPIDAKGIRNPARVQDSPAPR